MKRLSCWRKTICFLALYCLFSLSKERKTGGSGQRIQFTFTLGHLVYYVRSSFFQYKFCAVHSFKTKARLSAKVFNILVLGISWFVSYIAIFLSLLLAIVTTFSKQLAWLSAHCIKSRHLPGKHTKALKAPAFYLQFSWRKALNLNSLQYMIPSFLPIFT